MQHRTAVYKKHSTSLCCQAGHAVTAEPQADSSACVHRAHARAVRSKGSLRNHSPSYGSCSSSFRPCSRPRHGILQLRSEHQHSQSSREAAHEGGPAAAGECPWEPHGAGPPSPSPRDIGGRCSARTCCPLVARSRTAGTSPHPPGRPTGGDHTLSPHGELS